MENKSNEIFSPTNKELHSNRKINDYVDFLKMYLSKRLENARS